MQSVCEAIEMTGLSYSLYQVSGRPHRQGSHLEDTCEPSLANISGYACNDQMCWTPPILPRTQTALPKFYFIKSGLLLCSVELLWRDVEQQT